MGTQEIVLCHYAMKVWPHHSGGAWQLYGHSHGNLPDDPLSLSMDFGVDSHDFWPWHFNEIQAIMRVKTEAKALHRQRIDTIKIRVTQQEKIIYVRQKKLMKQLCLVHTESFTKSPEKTRNGSSPENFRNRFDSCIFPHRSKKLPDNILAIK